MIKTLSEIEDVLIPAGEVALEGELAVPHGAVGVVLFAHGSGSGRRSPRNRHVAEALRKKRIATLLFDLLTEEESEDRANVFDIDLLASRLLEATRWVQRRREIERLPIGYFGASTGAGAALKAAGAAGTQISAVVSRGGRPDLAGRALEQVTAPTLLLVGGLDLPVIGLNENAYRRLRCEKDLKIVPGATHLFEEPGTLDAVVRLAREWFLIGFGREEALEDD